MESRSSAKDVELALDAAHKAKSAWGKTSPTTRSNILNKIADRMEANLKMLAVAEAWENGKPVRETLAADIPLAIDHFQEPLGVVGQIIPWNFPILMATWKLAPALAAGNCVVIKPTDQTPMTLLLRILPFCNPVARRCGARNNAAQRERITPGQAL